MENASFKSTCLAIMQYDMKTLSLLAFNRLVLLLLLVTFQWGFLYTQSSSSASGISGFIKNIKNKNPEKYREQYNAFEKEMIKLEDIDNLLLLYEVHTDNLRHFSQFDSALVQQYKINRIIERFYPDRYAKACLDLAMIHYFLGNVDSLNYWYNKVQAKMDENEALDGELLILASVIAYNKSDFKLAVDQLIQAVKFFKEKGEDENLALTYQNLASAYGQIGELDLQNDYQLKAIKFFEEKGMTYQWIENYNALGTNMNARGRLDEALYCYDLVYDKLKHENYPLLLAQNNTNRANILEKKGLYDQAEQLFLEALNISSENGISYGVMLSNLNLGNLYRIKKKYDKSEKHLMSALEASIQMNTRREKALTYERLSWMERDRSNYKLAYEYQEKFFVLNDSLIGESVQKDVLKLREKYVFEKKENAILKLSEERIYMQYIIVLLLVILLAIALISQWFRVKSKFKHNELENQRQELKFKLELKQKELLTASLNKISVNNIKENISEKLKEIIGELPKSQAEKFKPLLFELHQNRDQNIIEEFEVRFTNVYQSFFDNLKANAHNITSNELRIAALIRLNLSTKEIASLTFRSIGTIDNIRSSIRKKLNLGENENLYDRLNDF